MKPLEVLSWFIPYFLVSAFHLYCCAAGKQRLRHFSKVLLLPYLLLTYLCTAQARAWPYFCALALGWIGDILLIRPDIPNRQKLGTAFFGLGHIFYILLLVPCIRESFAASGSLWTLWIWPPVFFVAAVLIYLWQRPLIPGALRPTGLGYYLLLAAVGSMAGLANGSGGGPWLLLGGVLFLTSDTILCRQFFTVGDPAPKYDFAVMLTYILAQLFLCLGFAAR